MSTTTDSLRELHQVHQRIREIRDALSQGQRLLEVRRTNVAKRTEELERARAEQKRLASQTATKELERKSKESRIADLQKKLLEATSNKEYQTLIAEQAAALAAKGALEDEMLDCMVREDELKAKMKTMEADLAKARQAVADQEAVVAQQTARLTAELATSERQLQEAETALPNDIQPLYRRLVTRYGADSLAPAVHGSCHGCFTMVTPQMQNQLAMSELVFCKSCGRILYLDQPATSTPA
jgi:hypothetical protein